MHQNGALASSSYEFTGLTAGQTYTYDDDWRLTAVSDRNLRAAYSYDDLDRLKEYDLKYLSNTEILDLTYNYQTKTVGGTTSHTNLLASVVDNNNSSNNLTFPYTDAGFLKSIHQGLVTKQSYT